jgi:hypothetical protein
VRSTKLAKMAMDAFNSIYIGTLRHMQGNAHRDWDGVTTLQELGWSRSVAGITL